MSHIPFYLWSVALFLLHRKKFLPCRKRPFQKNPNNKFRNIFWLLSCNSKWPPTAPVLAAPLWPSAGQRPDGPIPSYSNQHTLAQQKYAYICRERIRSILEDPNKCYFCEYKAPVPRVHPSKGVNLSGIDIWDHVWSNHPKESEWFA